MPENSCTICAPTLVGQPILAAAGFQPARSGRRRFRFRSGETSIVNAVGAGIGLFPVGIVYGAEVWGRTVLGFMAGSVSAALCISVELEAIPEAHVNVLAPFRLGMLLVGAVSPRLGALQRSLCSDESRTAPGPPCLRKSLPRRIDRTRARNPVLGDDGLAPVAGSFPGTNCRGVSRDERERAINPFALKGANIVRVARGTARSRHTRIAV